MKRLLLLLLFLPLPALAWTRASDERIALKAASLAPPDLRLVLVHLESEYKSGIARAEAEEGQQSHRLLEIDRRGRLRERIEAETATTIRMIRKGDPMTSVGEHLGTLAHLVADANNPFHVARDQSHLDLAENDFEQYFERQLTKFPTVFYGLDDLAPRQLLDRTVARTQAFYPLLGEEYLRGGEQRTSSDFDDRSTAFGVAAVCYSHAVTDLVNLYYYIWRESGGDVRSAAWMRSGNLLLSQ